jgi:class 3 adenylate cyclase
MANTLCREELAAESGVARERIDWLTSIGILKPREPGRFTFADEFRVKLVGALLDAGFAPEHIEWAASEGILNLDNVDDYLPVEPGPRSVRTFEEFEAAAGPRGSLLPAIYEVLGLPAPDPSSPLRQHEEELLQDFLEGWALAPSDETLIRAARLIGEGARMVALGWSELMVEVARPARERLLRGEVGRFSEEVRRSFASVFRLAPRMTMWLQQRYREQRSVSSIVEGFEEFFAARGLFPAPHPTAPPSVVFVDLSGYTRATEERGDEAAVGFVATLQRQAEAAAAANDGTLVKLLGDGAMLRFPDPHHAVEAAVSLIERLKEALGIPAHAGIHSGPVVERDLDLFGGTVNLASRIAEAAGPGQLLVSESVVHSASEGAWRFEPADAAVLKGIGEPVSLFRVVADESQG